MKRIRIALAAGAVSALTIGAVSFGVTHANGADNTQDHQYDHSTTEVKVDYPNGAPAKNRPAFKISPSRDVSHDLSYENSEADIVLENPVTGLPIASKRVHFGAHTQHRVMHLKRWINRMRHVLSDHGTGGTSTASGRVKVTIFQFGRTDAGHKLWTMSVWTDWSWTRATQVVSVNDTGRDKDVNDGAWSFIKWTDGDQGYYDWAVNDGHPHSAFQHMIEAEFDGPNIIVKVDHQYPTNILHSYYNGTNEWWTSCCS